MKKSSLALILALTLLFGASVSARATGAYAPVEKQQAMRQAVDALMESVFGAQYADGSSGFMVRWEDPLRVYIDGETTPEDLEVIAQFIRELNERVTWLPDISLVSNENNANVTIIMARLDDLSRFNYPGYQTGDWGSFSYWFEDSLIYSARLLIASDITTQEDRNYLIKMKLISALGLTGRLSAFKDSILYGEWQPRKDLSQVDWLMLNLLYELFLYPGITADEALNNLTSALAVPTKSSAQTGQPFIAQSDAPTQRETGGLRLNLKELSTYNGKNGRPAYVAVDGIIYNVTKSDAWNNGDHNGFEAGKDLTREIKNISPHGLIKLDNVPAIGRIVDE